MQLRAVIKPFHMKLFLKRPYRRWFIALIAFSFKFSRQQWQDESLNWKCKTSKICQSEWQDSGFGAANRDHQEIRQKIFAFAHSNWQIPMAHWCVNSLLVTPDYERWHNRIRNFSDQICRKRGRQNEIIRSCGWSLLQRFKNLSLDFLL